MQNIIVDSSNLNEKPKCPHGPTFKYTDKQGSYYACSYFPKVKCPFYKSTEEPLTVDEKTKWEDKDLKEIEAIRSLQKIYPLYCEKTSIPERMSTRFCVRCTSIVLPEDKSHNTHQIIRKISKDMIEYPVTNFIQTNSLKYTPQNGWLSDKAKQFIMDVLEYASLKEKILCIGSPSIFELVHNECDSSLLLDINKIYHTFYDKQNFIVFNMFNNYFPIDEEQNLEFVTDFANANKLTIVVEPPKIFNVEALARTLNNLLNVANNCYLFLIAPYYLESRIIEHFPKLKMLDYRIEYVTRSKMTYNRRLFIPKSIQISKSVRFFGKKYWYCGYCTAWASTKNRHCFICKSCTSKHGSAYNHCKLCMKCVESALKHCLRCKSCVRPNHKCNPQTLDEGSTQPTKKLKTT